MSGAEGLVERLRGRPGWEAYVGPLRIEAAAAITDLQAQLAAREAEVARLREQVDQLQNGPLRRLCEALNEPRATLGDEHGAKP